MVTALYRRYRPEIYSEMIGQSQVTEPLMTALRTGRIGHAYLFSGPRGCGKTSSARILARCLNCVDGPTDTPCGVCPSCVELSRDGGGSLDVIEIDAASHGGVDDARDLRERAIFAPARDRFKIFIIDEAHMVTKEGFNALLKIVEEPPEHVKFIFATTEPDKVIGTIRSRTHHYPFRLIPPAALLEYAQKLCDSEGVQVDAGVLPLVVRAGGGSARDTLSILDQLIAGSEGNTVSYERAVGLLGFTHEDLLDAAVSAFGLNDAAAAFGAVDRVVQTGQDPQRFVEDLLERFRDLIVVGATNVDGAAAVFRGVPEDQVRRMFEQSQSFSHGELSRVADTLSAGLDRMRGATAPRLHLELMVARALVAADAATAAVAASAPSSRPAVRGQMKAAQAAAAAAPPANTPSGTSPPANDPVEPVRLDSLLNENAPLDESSVPHESGVEQAQSDPAHPQPASSRSAAAAARALLAESPAPVVPPTERSVPDPEEPQPEEFEPDTSGLIGAVSEPIATPSPAGTIEQIRKAWPAILQRLLAGNRSAWLASRAVNPLALLEGGILGIAFENQTELEVFLAGETQPMLAAAVEAVTGISVRRYHPRPSRTGDLPRPSTEMDDTPEDPTTAEPVAPNPPSPVKSDPANAAPDPDTPSPTTPTAVSSSSAPSSGAGGWPTVAGPGAAARADVASAAPEAPVVRPSSESAPQTAPKQTTRPVAPELDELREAPDREEDASEQPRGVALPATAPARDATPPSAASSSAPSFTRYGEAVVREVLGATFIEELPRDQEIGR